jgi:hypothetical protein
MMNQQQQEIWRQFLTVQAQELPPERVSDTLVAKGLAGLDVRVYMCALHERVPMGDYIWNPATKHHDRMTPLDLVTALGPWGLTYWADMIGVELYPSGFEIHVDLNAVVGMTQRS